MTKDKKPNQENFGENPNNKLYGNTKGPSESEKQEENAIRSAPETYPGGQKNTK